ncbi:MAG: sodium:proton antiporter [bacterium]|nr:sodium:proton antiporter [bacterium]
MLLSITIVFMLALFLSYLFEKIHIPGLIGMIVTGIIVGPFVLNIIPLEILSVSKDLRTLALIIILIRAGLAINKSTLMEVGKNAVLLGILPCLLESFAIIFLSFLFLKMPLKEAVVFAFIIAAVSPAVVVPQMINLLEKKSYRKMPTLILSGASLDDIFAITMFSIFLKIAIGQATNFYLIPVNIFFGIFLGIIIGFIFVFLFEKMSDIRDTKKMLIMLLTAILFNSLEKVYPIATLLGIMVIGFVLLEKQEKIAYRISLKFNKLWIVAEVFLFTLIGAKLNIWAIKETVLLTILIIFFGLIFRSFGVLLSLPKQVFSNQERLFCVYSYLPKATVQAAIGSIPLSYGFEYGGFILQAAVLSILITAPLGAILIRKASLKYLDSSRRIS